MRTMMLGTIVLVAGVCGCAATRSEGPIGAIESGQYKELGWTAGAANHDNPTVASYFRIISVEKTPTEIVVTYDWKNGVMRLQSRRFEELERQGYVLAGTWHQDNAAGPIEFTFDADGRFVSGRWNDAATTSWYQAFLR